MYDLEKKSKWNALKILNVFLIIFLIIGCNTVYLLVYRRIIYVFITFFACSCITMKILKCKRYDARQFFPIMIYSILMIIACVGIATTNLAFIFNYVIILPLLLFYFQLLDYKEKKDFLCLLSDVIFVLVVVSTAVWFLGPIMGIIPSSNSIQAFWGKNTTYKGYCYIMYYRPNAPMKAYFGFTSISNNSFFAEAPVTNVVYSIGYSTMIFLKKEKNIVKELIFVFALVSTLSMTAIIMAIVFFGLNRYMGSNAKNKKTFINSKLEKVLLFCSIIAIVSFLVARMLQIKSETDSVNYDSHLGAFGSAIKIFLEHPIFGTGYNDQEEHGNTTSGLFKVLTDGGIVFIMVYLFPFLASVFYSLKMKDKSLLSFYFTTFFLVVMVVWHYTPLYMFVLAFEYSFAFQPKVKEQFDLKLKYLL